MFQSILVPVNLAHPSSWRKALPVAVAQARRHNAALTVITVMPDVDRADDKKTPRDRARELQALVDEQVPRAVTCQAQVVRGGSIHRSIRRTAQELGCDLIVMNSHDPELRDYLIGSNAAQVVRQSRCSVLVVR